MPSSRRGTEKGSKQKTRIEKGFRAAQITGQLRGGSPNTHGQGQPGSPGARGRHERFFGPMMNERGKNGASAEELPQQDKTGSNAPRVAALSSAEKKGAKSGGKLAK